MLHIALCDDQPGDLVELRRALEEYRRAHPALELEVHAYADACAVLDAAMEFDLFLLDILMPGLDGIALGRELRSRFPAALLLYLTSSTEFALESYGAEAMSYLVKPVSRETLFHALDRAVALCRRSRAEAVTVRMAEGARMVYHHELMSVETLGRSLCYRLWSGETLHASGRTPGFEQVRDSLASDGRFLLIRRGCLVNMDYIVFLGDGELELAGGLRLPVARSRRVSVRHAYLSHCCKSLETGDEGEG